MLKKYNGQIISFRFKKSNNITHFTEFLLNIVKTSSLLRGTRHTSRLGTGNSRLTAYCSPRPGPVTNYRRDI